MEAGENSVSDKAALPLHAGLPKARSSILAQIRTGKIRLAALLHRGRISGFVLLGLSPWVVAGGCITCGS